VTGSEPDAVQHALLGRERECAAIDGLLRRAGAGESGSLVIRGEPGVGKSALLAYAERTADGILVLRTAGQEAESTLTFAGLHGFLRPITHRLPDLPAHQADALAGALGLAPPRRSAIASSSPPRRSACSRRPATTSLCSV